jgi:hypothetical protein
MGRMLLPILASLLEPLPRYPFLERVPTVGAERQTAKENMATMLDTGTLNTIDTVRQALPYWGGLFLMGEAPLYISPPRDQRFRGVSNERLPGQGSLDTPRNRGVFNDRLRALSGRLKFTV